MVRHEALRVGFGLGARCEAGPIKHIQHIGHLGHSGVDADEATNTLKADYVKSAFGGNVNSSYSIRYGFPPPSGLPPAVSCGLDAVSPPMWFDAIN